MTIEEYNEITRERPLVPALLQDVLGRDPWKEGIYGPWRKETFTYSSYPVDTSGIPEEMLALPEGIQVVHINQVLRKGFIVLTREPEGLRPLLEMPINWGMSAAWGESGSWASLYLNVRNRQASGIVCAPQYYEHLEKLERRINRDLPDAELIVPAGRWDCDGVPPDLMVRMDDTYFTDLV